MLGKKMGSFKKLAKKMRPNSSSVGDFEDNQTDLNEDLITGEQSSHLSLVDSGTRTPRGYFAVYVGEERERFVVRTSSLSHPLVKILLEKSYSESVGHQKSRLVVPCSVYAFREALNAVECRSGRFDFGDADEFI